MERALAEALRTAAYDRDSIAELTPAGSGLAPGQAYAALRFRPEGATRLGLLVRLFLAYEELDGRDVAAAVAPAGVDELVSAGVLRRRGSSRLRSAVRIGTFRDALVVSDPNRWRYPIPRNHVL